MKKQLSILLAASSIAMMAPAHAWESGNHSTSASVSIATDYIWRGYTQTQNEPAISGSFDYAHASGFYAGIWASNVDFRDDASSEIDFYAGFSSEFGDSGIGYDIGVLRYVYDDEDYDWNEIYGSLSYSYFTLGIAHSSNVYDSSESGTYYSLGFDYTLPADIGLSLGVGFYDYDKGAVVADKSVDHVDYYISLSKSLIGFDWTLAYTGMDSDGRSDTKGWGDDADSQVVLSLSKSF